MLSVIMMIALVLISYLLGCFSTAKILAKSYRNINIYKIGTGHPDTLNIYYNIDKLLGIFTGVLDIGKIFFYLAILKWILFSRGFIEMIPGVGDISSENHLLIIGFSMIIGHCLPITHKFKGGRGIFTYIGFLLFFAPWSTLIVCSIALILVCFFNQIRFSQYMIVMLTPFVNFFFIDEIAFLAKMFLAALLMGIMNFFVSKQLGEI
jgi:acyl phosphate:glycerol-3-phosphate acyltransferase